MELYKDILGCEGIYQVSNLGNVKRLVGYQCKAERILKPIDNGFGYLSVSLSINGKVAQLYVHRLVATAFILNVSSNPKVNQVNHINGIKNDNHFENLEWVTSSENHRHKYDVLKQKGANTGRLGALSGRSKPVIMFDLGGSKIKEYPGVMEAMRKTGVHESNIRCCIYGKSNTAGGYVWKYKN